MCTYSYGLYDMAYVLMAYIVMGYMIMVYLAMVYSYDARRLMCQLCAKTCARLRVHACMRGEAHEQACSDCL